MTVAELISHLETVPGDMEVMFDITPPAAEMFHFVSIDNVEKIETSEKEEYILLSTEAPGMTPPPNLN